MKEKKKPLKPERIVVAVGTFDPLESDDIKLFKKAKKNYDWLIVGVFSDNYLLEYHGGYVCDHKDRMNIVSEIRYVDEVMKFKDSDGTACTLLQLIKVIYPGAEIFFITDGVENKRIPEAVVDGITIIKCV